MTTDQFQLNFLPERRIYRVAELSRLIREKLEAEFTDIWVDGEVSNCKEAPSGHLYFTLKDESAQLRCICFRQQARYLRFRPEDGLQVMARGRIGVYEPRGEYQLYVDSLEPQGVGALQLAFEQLKKKLAAEGLFDAARKKPLPRFPRRIGIITSPTGAVIRDIIRVLERRHDGLHLLVYPVRVQGDGAAEEIINALRFFHLTPPKGLAPEKSPDVLILARGGGSLEDLWAFNEEKLARAIAACSIPVISAVGHETDFTIADFVADLRAPTPSAAAEMVVETKQQLQQQVSSLEDDLVKLLRYRLLQHRHDLTETMAHRGFQTLRTLLAQAAQRHDEASNALAQGMRDYLLQARRAWEQSHAFLRHFDLKGRNERARLRWNRHNVALANAARLLVVRRRASLDALSLQLDQLSPRKILERGYAIAFDADGNVLRDAAQTATGQPINVRLARGRLGAVVDQVLPE